MFYLSLLVLLVLLAYFYDFRGKRNGAKFWFNAILYIFIFLSGFRYYVGADTFDYVFEYDNYPDIFDFSEVVFSESRYQPGWIIFMVFCKTLSNSFVLPQLLTAIIVNYSIFKIIRNYSNYPFLVVLFYYCAQVFTGLNFEFMRESLAVGISFLGFEALINKKWLKYYFIVMLAFMIHVSASICFLIPLMNYVKLNNKRFFIIIALVYFSLIFFGRSLIEQFISFVVFDNKLATRAQGYGNSAIINERSFNYYLYTFSTYVFFPLILIYLSILKYRNKINFPNILLLYFIISIFSSLSAHFIRFNHYLFIFLIIEVVNAFYLVFFRFKPKLLLLLCFPLLFNFTNLHYMFYNYFTSNNNEEVFRRYYPYNSVIDRGMPNHRRDYYVNFHKTKRDFSKY